MYSPVLVTPAAAVVSLADAKAHLYVDHDDDDTIITAFVAAATAHVERVSGVALGAQTWQLDFSAFDQYMRLPIGPVTSITSVTYINEAGDPRITVNAANYSTVTTALGTFVRFIDDYSLPSDLYETAPVRVTWVAGHAVVPAPLIAAVKMIVGDLYENRETKVVNSLQENVTVSALLSTYRVY